MRVPAGIVSPWNSTVFRRHPVAELVGRLEAQEFVDGGVDHAGIGLQPLLLLRPFQQLEQRVADQVGRRLVAGIEDEDAVLQQLGLGKLLALRRAVDQRVSTSVAGSPGFLRRRATRSFR
jgi:hypothetical protein